MDTHTYIDPLQYTHTENRVKGEIEEERKMARRTKREAEIQYRHTWKGRGKERTRERENEWQRKREKEKKTQRKREIVCLCAREGRRTSRIAATHAASARHEEHYL